MHTKTLPSEQGLCEKVCALVSATLELPPNLLPLRVETHLYGAGLGLDSVDALRLVAALEEEFDITIEDMELTPSTLESVGSIISLIRSKLVCAT